MEKLVACCGLDCVTCDARIATIKKDDELRKATAAKWRIAFNAPDITAEMINCTGCREKGVKFNHCEICEIRKCVNTKGFDTCGDCQYMSICEIVTPIHRYVPEAISNLKSLK
jgi:hypothetical protein